MVDALQAQPKRGRPVKREPVAVKDAKGGRLITGIGAAENNLFQKQEAKWRGTGLIGGASG